MTTNSAIYAHPGSARITLDREVVLAFSVVMVGVVMSIVDVTVAGNAMNALAREIQAELSTIRWIVTGYALALGPLIPIAVWADRLATKRLSLISISVYMLGSILLGLAWQWIFLINVPVGAVALLTTALVLPPDASQRSSTGTVPELLSTEQQRVLAAFLRGQLPAGRLETELARHTRA